jgi:hypothetical protein
MKGSDKKQTMFRISAGENFWGIFALKKPIKMSEDNIKMDFSKMCWDNGW